MPDLSCGLLLVQSSALTNTRPRQAKRPYCLPCKARRVKCDMIWPACTRCLRRTRTCEWDDRLLPTAAAGQHDQVDDNLLSIALNDRLDPCAIEFHSLVDAVRTCNSLPKIETPLTILSSSDSSRSNSSLEESSPSVEEVIEILPPSLDVDKESLYTNAFFNGWLKKHVVEPEGWTVAFLQHRSTPLLKSAIQLLGTLQIDPRVSIAKYQKCITLLQRKLRKVSDQEALVESCVTITLLAGYEICFGTIEAFGHHLHAVCALIRCEIQAARARHEPSKLFMLVTCCCLDMEMVYNFLVRGAPKLTWQEWQHVLPLEAESTEEDFDYRRLCEAVHFVNSLTSQIHRLDEYKIIMDTGIELLRRYTSVEVVPWICELEEYKNSDSLRMLWSHTIPVLSPYTHIYLYPSKSPSQSMFHTTYALVFRILELHLICSQGLFALSVGLDEKCNFIAGMIAALGAVNQSEWWCLLGTWTLVKYYKQILPATDTRLLYNQALLGVLFQMTSTKNWNLLESRYLALR